MDKKPNIMIIATGGTIAGDGKSSVKSGYSSGKLGIQSLINNIPDLNKIAKIKTYQLTNIGSQAMNDKTLLLLAKKANEFLKKPQIDALVIIHGTDTLEESAYFLNLCVKSKKPIIFTGSMRSNSSLSNDGDMNIFNAVNVAANKKSRKKGVLLVLNDEIHSAREVTKTNTSNLNTFASPNTGKIGSVYYGKVNFYFKSLKLHTYKSKFDIDLIKSLPRVDIIYSHINDTDIFVDAAIKAGAKGIISAGFGNGNIYPKTLKALHKASKKGICIIRSSRTGSGRVSLGCEIDDKKYGFLIADNLNPQKARILLSLALTKTQNPKKIQKMFLQY
ncbi:MAG: L-asparaginase 2 [Proteobacteria bacterium]|nr:MAG: L-asparaginase 2 [Pseudomonadota bacterium]